ncbi:hypothetical protein L218DRAFT_1079784 [Marasmius fiardii PR-910]|nr:hypothetical protein L218DRAFT_1079784 [Marasmius fiardii PR-910]
MENVRFTIHFISSEIQSLPHIGGTMRAVIDILAILAAIEASILVKSSEYDGEDSRGNITSSEEPSSLKHRLLVLPVLHLYRKHPNRIRNPSPINFNLANKLENSLYVVGLSVIVLAIIQQSFAGLSPYHTLIIMNISLTLSSAGLLIGMARPDGDATTFKDNSTQQREKFSNNIKVFVRDLRRNALHVLLSAFGLYFWVTQGTLISGCPFCTTPTYYWFLGFKLPISFPLLRVYSLVFYPLFISPSYALATIILVMVAPITTLTLVASIIALVGRVILQSLVHRFPSTQRAIGRFSPPFIWLRECCRSLSRHLSSPAASAYASFIACVFFILYMIVSTEMTIKMNEFSEEGNVWSFGQMSVLLSVILTIVPYAYGRYEWHVKDLNDGRHGGQSKRGDNGSSRSEESREQLAAD